MISARSARLRLLLLAAAMLAVILAAPWFGGTRISWTDVVGWFDSASSDANEHGRIFWMLRVPRVLMAALAGLSLASAGAVFQATFRNPLADPFTLGVASGAALGATAALHLRWTGATAGVSTVTLAAFAGALVSVVIVYAVAGTWRRFGTDTLLLAGISIGFICAAGVLLIQYLSIAPVTNETVRWLMGSVVQVGYDGVLGAAPLVIIGLGVVAYLHRELDLFMMGDLVAAGRGVALGRARAAAYFAASAMTAAVVAHCGAIAFVGLVVPHIARAFVGATHARLLPAAAMGGATFLILCDFLSSRMMGWLFDSPMQIPVGVLTNLIGGVFFLYVLLTRRSGGAGM